MLSRSAIMASMAAGPRLLVRNLGEDVVAALKRRAAANGNSVEEEHRRILRRVLLGPKKRAPSLSEYLLAIPRAPIDDEDDVFAVSRTSKPRQVPFAEDE